MKDVVLESVQTIIIAVLPVIAAFLCYLLKQVASAIMDKCKTDKQKEIISMAEDSVANAVACVMQTYVDALKRSDSFNLANQQIAFESAKEKALEILTKEAQELIKSLYGSIDTWLEISIEAQVRAQKKEKDTTKADNNSGSAEAAE